MNCYIALSLTLESGGCALSVGSADWPDELWEGPKQKDIEDYFASAENPG